MQSVHISMCIVPLVLVHSTHSGQNQVPDGRVYLPGRRDITMSNNSEWWSTYLKCIQCQLCVWWVWVYQSLHAVNICLFIYHISYQSNTYVKHRHACCFIREMWFVDCSCLHPGSYTVTSSKAYINYPYGGQFWVTVYHIAYICSFYLQTVCCWDLTHHILSLLLCGSIKATQWSSFASLVCQEHRREQMITLPVSQT